MKKFTPIRLLIIGAIVLALVSTSAMAISKSELIAFHKTKIDPEHTSSNFSVIINFTTPSPTPTPTPYIPSVWALPTPVPSSGVPSWFIPSYSLIPWKVSYPPVTPAPAQTVTPSSSTGCAYASCPPAVPVGYLHHTFCRCMSYKNAITGEVSGQECINPETGEYYPIGMDALGNSYIVKPGCTARWAD
jgi:hypothetical protein